MSNISEKTLIDLEFLTIVKSVSELCISELGKNEALQIRPFSTEQKLIPELNLVNEYLSSFQTTTDSQVIILMIFNVKFIC